MGVVEGLLRGRRAPGEPVTCIVSQRLEADARASPYEVEEQVGRDAVQPALEGAGGVVLQRPEHPDEDVLRDVFGVVLVAGEAVGKAVDASAVRLHDLVPRRRSPGEL